MNAPRAEPTHHARAQPARNGFRHRIRGLLGYVVVVGGTAGARASSFAAAVIIARELGPSGFGDFTLFFAVLVPFISATDFLDIGYVRHASGESSPRATAYLRGTLILKIGALSLLVLLALPIAHGLADLVFQNPGLSSTLFLAIIAGTFVGLISLRASTYLAREEYVAYGIVNSLFYVASLIALVGYALATSRVSLDGVYAIFFLCAVLLGLACLASTARDAWPIRPRRDVLRELAGFAKWMALAQGLFVIAQRLDVMLLSRYVSIREVGQYGAGLRVTVVASLMIGSMASFLLPRAARATGSTRALRGYVTEGAYLSGILCVGVLGVWLAAPLLVPFFFGSEFEPAVGLTRTLLLGVAFLALATPIVQLLISEDRPRHVPVYLASKYVVLAMVTLVLAPQIGASGAAWAYAASEGVGLAYALAILGIRWRAVTSGA